MLRSGRLSAAKLVGVIEDWTEVLTAHDESFLTSMMVIE